MNVMFMGYVGGERMVYLESESVDCCHVLAQGGAGVIVQGGEAMSCGEYNLPIYKGSLIAENNGKSWMIEVPGATVVQKASLEDEIRLLRVRMEKIFLEEQSFTADIVVEISSLLDLKLNEYMKARNNQSPDAI